MDERIEHVVVLMLENRSFDHLLGHLSHGGLQPLSEDDSIPADPTDPQSEPVPVTWHDSYSDVTVDPGHGYDDVMKQLTGHRGPWPAPYRLSNNGFVWNYASRRSRHGTPPLHPHEIMRCYPAKCIPVISTLAREFAVCSRWFCSLPSETWPNRLFVHSGTSHGSIEREELIEDEPTIFKLLDDEGRDSRVYAGDVPQALTYFWQVRSRWSHMSQFEDDVQRGRLPAYSFIEPRHFDSPLGVCNSQHPVSTFHGITASGHVWPGEALLARVYMTLRSVQDVWTKTLLIVTYDEHGGFFDRVPPPAVLPTGEVAPNDFPFDLLGPRVPAVVVSPYIPAATVVADRTFEHTSIPATVREVFGIDRSLSPREEAAPALTALLTLARPRVDDTPDLSDFTDEDRVPREAPIEGVRETDDFQSDLLALMDEVDRREDFEVEPSIEEAVDVGLRVERFVRRHRGETVAP